MTLRCTKPLLTAILLPLLLGACIKRTKFMTPSGTEQRNTRLSSLGDVVTSQTSAGATRGDVSSLSSITQTMQAPQSSAVAGAAVSFPPGSLAVATTVSMEQAVPLATPVTAAQLGIFGNIGGSGTPLVIQSSARQDAVTPFTVAVSLPPEASLDQNSYFDRLIILYRTQPASGECYVGIILRSEITIKNGFAYFSTSYFGSYQAVYTNSVVPTAVKVAAPSSAMAKSAAASLPAMQLSTRSPLIVRAGSTVTLTGKNFRPSLTLAMAGRGIGGVTVASDSSASFFVPSGVPGGVVGLSLEQDGTSQSASLVFSSGAADHPFSTKPASEICQGEQFYDVSGSLQTGTRNCGGPSSCTVDGQTGCVATQSYPAAIASGLALKVTTGQTVAGIAGTVTQTKPPASCAVDGQTGCVTTQAYPAAMASGLALKVVAGQTVAAVAGTVTLPPAAYVLTGTSYGAAAAIGGSLTLPPAALVSVAAGSYGVGGTGTLSGLINCSADGLTNCVTSGSFKSADMSLALSGNIKSGATVAGVAGSYAAPCLSDGQQNCLTTGVFKAANVTGISTWDLRSGQTLAGISGALKTNCRNTVTSTSFNYDGAVASLPTTAITSGTSADYWDTADDYYGTSATVVSGWGSNTNCDQTNFTDVTTLNGGSSTTTCGTGSTCIYKDNISNLRVTGALSSATTTTGTVTNYTWAQALNTCSISTYGGYAAGSWRLPTQKELFSLYEHGVSGLNATTFISLAALRNLNFWSASSSSSYAVQGWVVAPGTGLVSAMTKTAAGPIVCVM